MAAPNMETVGTLVNATLPTNVTHFPLIPGLNGNETLSGGRGISDCAMFHFVFFTIVTGMLCLLGIIGNTVSIFVLQKDRGNEVATFLLQALAIADNSCLIISFVTLSVLYGLLTFINVDLLRTELLPYLYKYVEPCAHMAQTATIWMTVLLAVNRYIAICRPFDTSRLSTSRTARIHVALVFAFSILFNIPRFFQFDIEKMVVNNVTVVTHRPSAIGRKTMFGIVYTNALHSILVLVLPLVVLVVLNSKLILELRKMRRRRRSSSASSSPAEDNITTIMITIIVIFILCHTPDRIREIALAIRKGTVCPHPLHIYECICIFLVILNSSVNFFVYYIFRRRFRQILINKICRWAAPLRRNYNSQASDSDMQGNVVSLLSANGTVTFREHLGQTTKYGQTVV